MNQALLRAFVAGASWPTFILFFRGFHGLLDRVTRPDNAYFQYTQIAPLYLGIMSAAAVALQQATQWSLATAFAVVSVISALVVSTYITVQKTYDFDRKRLMRQYGLLLLFHFAALFGIAQTLYRSIS